MFKRFLVFLFLIAFLLNCKSVKITKNIVKKLNANFYENQFTGLLVYNPRLKDTIISYHANKYFTPASNTKIFTLFTTLQILKDSIPAFKYFIEKDTITIKGTGNPTFLHSYFNDSTVLKMAQKFKKIKLVFTDFSDKKYGSGWAWEDYDTYFSPERSAFPIYGNVLTITNKDSLQYIPSILKNEISYATTKFNRNSHKNKFFYDKKKTKPIEVPMIIDSLLTIKLWNAILPNKVSITSESPKIMKSFFSVKADSLYKRMMYESDNFLAEQMLIMASSKLYDTLSSKKIRKHILKNQLKHLRHKPRWVDGSGLSRYNLFTPTSFVQVLDKLYNELPKKRLFNFFPVGGKSGTLKKWYAGNPRPYIYAKSGTLSNNYSLSGYLITNKGETLIFSFMNNHYQKNTAEIKNSMQSVFEYLRDNY